MSKVKRSAMHGIVHHIVDGNRFKSLMSKVKHNVKPQLIDVVVRFQISNE